MQADSKLQRIADIWQPHSSCPLGAEDAREIARNVVGFFTILAEWDHLDCLAVEHNQEQQPCRTSST